MSEEKIIACVTYVAGVILLFNPAPELKYIGAIITITLLGVSIYTIYQKLKAFVSKRKKFK